MTLTGYEEKIESDETDVKIQDIYDTEELEVLLENDEFDSREYAFMEGYDSDFEHQYDESENNDIEELKFKICPNCDAKVRMSDEECTDCRNVV